MAMINEIHTKTNLLALGEVGVDMEVEVVSPMLDDGTFFLGPAASSPVIMSAQAVMDVVHAKKRLLSQRMNDLTQG